ncbi:MAG: cereblon family protein [Magnetospiraceae bacterium]
MRRNKAVQFRDPGEAGAPSGRAKTADKQDDRPKKFRCKQCDAVIADADARIPVHGAHEHDFQNPAGLGFRISCFAAAPGVIEQGTPSFDFTWFPTYAWRVARCAHCSWHLGWSYEGAEAPRVFHGLILTRLVSA